MPRRTIVLGARGYIGRAVCRALIQSPECDLVAAHFRRTPVLAELLDDGMWRALDLTQADPSQLVELIDSTGADVVVNCAGASFGSPEELRAANFDVVTKLATALRRRPGVRLVHIGSAAEYGAHWPGQAITEDAVPNPVGGYGITKLEATMHLLGAAERGDLSVTVMRVFNPIGRESPAHTLTGRAAREIDAASRSGADTVLLGSLESWRDFIDVRDVATAVVAAVSTGDVGANVYNVGRGEAILTRDLIEHLAIIAGYTGAIAESDTGSPRSSPIPWQRADITAAATHLGWTPQHTIDAALRDLWSGVLQGAPA